MECLFCGASFPYKANKRFCRRLCKQNFRSRKYRSFKDSTCVICGFKAIHKCQLDVDHIDGDHSNNTPSNLQTLCANCHRLKTYKQRWGSD